jgi:hypothetical protein
MGKTAGWPPRARRRGLLRSPTVLFVVVSASLAGFEGMHRGLGLHPLVSSALLMVVYAPLLGWGILLTVSAILADPDNLAHSILWAFSFALLTIVFFAVLYSELGIVPAGSDGPVIRDLVICLYFSAATFTTLGYGDFAPTPDSRLLAAVEALTGYLILGTITAVVFFLLSRWAGRIHRNERGG